MDAAVRCSDELVQTAYGLSFRGLPDVPELMSGEPGDTQPAVRISLPAGVGSVPAVRPLDASRCVRRLRDGRVLDLDRAAGTAVFHGAPLAAGVLAHPYLGPVATTFNRWSGRESFHAGAFVVDGRAWVVLGPRTAGKSSLLAALAARRLPVLSDDIVVTDGRDVFTGPRCLDLRRPLPAGGVAVSPARDGSRWRLLLPPVSDRVPLGGWIFLRWGSELTMEPLPARELVRRLAVGRAGPGLASDPSAFLSLATLPAWDLERPQDWDRLDATLDRLVGTVS